MFAVDLDELAATVAALARCDAELDAVLSEVTAQVVALHGTWRGLAADAQAAAQAEWDAGFREMSRGLAAMRAAGAAAHDRYDAAATTNLRMWEQVS